MPRPKKTETERHTASYPRVPATPTQVETLKRLAAKRGYGKKIAPYIRDCTLKETPADEPGMPVDEVMKNLADIGRAMGNLTNPATLKEILERIAARHMNVIKP